MINFQRPAFSDRTISVTKICTQGYCLSSELYKATVQETQEHTNKTA